MVGWQFDVLLYGITEKCHLLIRFSGILFNHPILTHSPQFRNLIAPHPSESHLRFCYSSIPAANAAAWRVPKYLLAAESSAAESLERRLNPRPCCCRAWSAAMTFSRFHLATFGRSMGCESPAATRALCQVPNAYLTTRANAKLSRQISALLILRPNGSARREQPIS